MHAILLNARLRRWRHLARIGDEGVEQIGQKAPRFLAHAHDAIVVVQILVEEILQLPIHALERLRVRDDVIRQALDVFGRSRAARLNSSRSGLDHVQILDVNQDGG
jgi:hypothetical protein